VGAEASEPEASAQPDESVRDEAVSPQAKRDAEGFLIDESYAKEQLRDAVVDVLPPTAAEGS
jgi:hypothetical protein